MLDTLIYIIDYFGLDRKRTGKTIFFIHFVLSILIGLVMLLFDSRKIIMLLMVLTVLHNILYMYFRGCIITQLERRLTDSNYTIIDPILYILNIEKTNTNRHHTTLFFVVLVWIILIYKVCID